METVAAILEDRRLLLFAITGESTGPLLFCALLLAPSQGYAHKPMCVNE
jgi:hypothetical protein